MTATRWPWLAALKARAEQPPLRARVPLLWQGAAIGSVEPEFIAGLASVRASCGGLVLSPVPAGGWQVEGPLTESLALVADEMRRRGLAAAWRDEQLAVPGPDGAALGTIERAAVRPLGIATHAVHLVGFATDGRMWVQQRAFDKPNDPGLWDTLMGGMVPASDSLQDALARETWEEAGLSLAQLEDLVAGGRVSFRRPSEDGRGAGYVVEHIDWFRCTVPDGVEPVNQDGEVAAFRLVDVQQVLRDVGLGAYTLEAALIIADACCSTCE